jgi:hypothetical protein
VTPTLQILTSVASLIKTHSFQVRCAVLVEVDQQVKMKQMVMKTRLESVPTQTMESQTQTAPHVLLIRITHTGAIIMIRTHSFQVKCAAPVVEVLILIVTTLQIMTHLLI